MNKNTIALLFLLVSNNSCPGSIDDQNTNSSSKIPLNVINSIDKNFKLEADRIGPTKASSSRSKFQIQNIKDNMTGTVTQIAVNDTKLGNGTVRAIAQCIKFYELPFISIRFKFIDLDAYPKHTHEPLADPKQPYILPESSFSVDGRLRINGSVSALNFSTDSIFSRVHGKYPDTYEFNSPLILLLGSLYIKKPNKFNKITYYAVYDLAFEIPTNQGVFYIEASPYDSAISKITKDCK